MITPAVASAVLGALQVVHSDTGPAKVLNDETVSPGTVGSIVVGVLIVAVVFLLRSFLKQVRRVPPDFETKEAPPADPAPDDPAGVVPRSDDGPA